MIELGSFLFAFFFGAAIAIFVLQLVKEDYIAFHGRKFTQTYQAWLGFGRHNGFDRLIDTSWEISTHKIGPGFKLHFGNRGSDTPIDIMIGFYWVTFFIGLDWRGCGEFCEKFTGGHKRNISMRIHGGKLWWELWYDDDMGYDSWHECDKWAKPKVWPWSMGRTKYRSWMCLRDGSLELNPFTALWGGKVFKYEEIDEDVLLVELNEFPGDEYMIQWHVQRRYRQRTHGPKFARRPEEQGYIAEWEVPEGVQVNTSTDDKGRILETQGAIVIDDPNDWRLQACDEWAAKIRQMRRHATLRSMTEAMRKAGMSMNDMASAMRSAAESLKKMYIPLDAKLHVVKHPEYDGFGAPISNPPEMTVTVSGVNLEENERLKTMYTPEELAQQAINRDKEES